MIKNKWIGIGVVVVLVAILIAYAGYMHTQKECKVDVNNIRIQNLLLQSSLHPYAIVDMEIYNFKNTEMFVYFSEFNIYANGKLIGSEKESEEEVWSVKVNGKRDVKLYLNVTGEKLAELLKKSEYLTVKGTLHIYGYANEKLPAGMERSEVDIQFEKRIKPSIYDYDLSYALDTPKNASEEILKDAEDILHKRLSYFNVKDFYIQRNNTCIKIYFQNESQKVVNDICKQGKVEFRSRTNPLDRIEVGMELNEIQNITEHVLYSEDIKGASFSPVPVERISPTEGYWGISIELSVEGVGKVIDAVKRYRYDPEFSEAYEFQLPVLIDDRVAYNMTFSTKLFREFLRDRPVYSIVMPTGPGEAGKKEAEKLICYFETGPLPFKMEVEK